MKIESLQLPGSATPAPGQLKPGILLAALVFSALFWLFAWYWDTALSAIDIWERSDTFAHGFLIFPISGWLIWQRRHVLAGLELRPNFLALLAIALVGFGWLLARLAGVVVVQQFSLVLLIPLLLWAVAGSEIVRTLAFPLFFLLFAVPFGEFLEPVLMRHTADFTIATLKLTGIPVYREGLYFTIPSGSWSVVEACSGLRYLIASMTLGLLYAYLTYRSFKRRMLFVVAALIVPIFANWLRAYMIVMIGHLSSMKLAVGVDHLVYGWLFFGVVMLILFWVGSYWREDVEPAKAGEPLAPQARARNERSLPAVAAATVAAAIVIAVWPAAAAHIEDADVPGVPVLRAPPGAGGWQAAEGRVSSWKPSFQNFRASVSQVYSDGQTGVGLAIFYYRHQRAGFQLVSSTNRLVTSGNNEWRRVSETSRAVLLDDGSVPAIEASLRSGPEQLLVWRWYWIDGEYIVNPYWAKALQAKSRLFGRGDDGAIVVVYALAGEGNPAAEQKLQAFVRAMLPGISTSLEHARQTRLAP